jgi:hypothetical protein
MPVDVHLSQLLHGEVKRCIKRDVLEAMRLKSLAVFPLKL